MSRYAKAVRLGAALAVAAALAACQTGPAPPLLSPLDQAKRYGFTERELAPDRVEVTYLGPRRRVTSYMPKPRDGDTQPARTEALDLATWRAAQLALARGFKGFRVVDRQTHVDSHLDTFYPGPESAGFPYWREPGALIYAPPSAYAPPLLTIQALAVVSAQLLNELQPGDQEAAAAIARLRAAYPGAEGK